MVAERDEQENAPVARFPQTLGLKDLITVVSISVTLALAWGVFGTRITVVENDIITLKQAAATTAADKAELTRLVERVREQQLRQEIFIDHLYEAINKTPPRKVPQP
jgi:hypothetical protein